jgi:O-antigen ligase
MGGALGVFLLIFLVLPGMYRPWLIAAAVLGAAVLTVGQWENILAFKRDKNLSAQETANSAQLRPILAAIAWEMFCDRPMLGCGLAHYTDQHIYYTGDRSTELPLEQGRGYVQHNIWLSLLTETGLIGMSLFAAVVVSWILSAWRLWQARGSPLWMRQQGLVFLALAVNFLMQGLFHDMTIMLMMHMILFFMAGVTVNLQARSEEKG